MHRNIAEILYRLIQVARDEPVESRLAALRESQWLPLNQVHKEQWEKLRLMLVWAYEKIPYYKSQFDACGFNPDTFGDQSSLMDIPYLNKGDIQENFNILYDKSRTVGKSLESTSGSTGNPMQFWVDRAFGAGFRAQLYRCREWAGLRLGDKEARFYGMPLNGWPRTREYLKDFLMNRKRFSVFDLSDKAMERYWRAISRFRPAYLYGYTSALSRFTDYIKSKAAPRKMSLKAIIATAEILHPWEKELMEEVWQVPVFNEYGCSELGILAGQCEHGGMHWNVEDNFIEIIKDGRPAETGEKGEVVVTNLNNRLMPFIRYRTGDVAAFAPGPCGCGRKLPLLADLEGRVSAMALTSDGRVVSGWFFYYLFRSLLEHKSQGEQLLVVQKSLDHIHVTLRKKDGQIANFENIFTRKCRDQLGPDVRVTFQYVAEIPETISGKRLHFLSELDVDIAGNQIPKTIGR